MSAYLTPAQARERLGVSRFVFDKNIRPQLTEISHGDRTARFDALEIEAYLADAGGMFNKKKVRDALDHAWSLRWQRAKGATKKGYIKKVVDRELGAEPVTIGYERLCAWVEDMRNRDLAPATIRARMSCLMFALKEAAKLRWIKQEPPVPTIEAANAKDRYLADEPDEETMLIEACGCLQAKACDVMRLAIVFLLDTGCRLSELVKLRSDGLSKAGARFEGRKAGDSLTVPLTPAARDAIEALLENGYWRKRVRGAAESKKREESAVSWVSHRFIEIRDKAGLRDVTAHSLRHTFASRLVQSGVSIYKVQKLLGHASITQTERYSHLAPDNLSDELAALENRRLPNKVRALRTPTHRSVNGDASD